MSTESSIFHRTELLLGNQPMQRLATIRVILFGVGGVGSWCAESLVRSGVQHLTIVDFDSVCASNVNRQLMATSLTIGQPKVNILRQRLLAINPDTHITALQQVFDQETAQDFDIGSYDYVIDAIDSLQDKALLILTACKMGVKLFSSMGAALKMDPTQIRVTEFWKVKGDPLARALRKRFKRSGTFPSRKFLCVYSNELLQNKAQDTISQETLATPQKRVNGTVAHITAIFGFMLAGLVVQDVCQHP